MKTQGHLYNDDYFTLGLLGIVFGSVFVCIIGKEVFNIIKCYYFPELQIYEYISNYIK